MSVDTWVEWGKVITPVREGLAHVGLALDARLKSWAGSSHPITLRELPQSPQF